MVKKAILPVAGMGTRFLPATKVVPKELLPIGDKPVIQYLVEEAVNSGIEEIIFVISKEKELIRDYFSHHPKLESHLIEKNKPHLHEKVKSVHELAKFHFVYQDKPLGDGHAILMAESLIDNEPFAVMFGDDIIKHETPGIKQLINNFKGECVIAVEEVSPEKISAYGVIKPGEKETELLEIEHMVEKPKKEEAPSNYGIIGKYICTPEIFESIKNAQKGHGGELRLIDGLINLKNTQKIWALPIKGRRFDTGHPKGLNEAGNAFLD